MEHDKEMMAMFEVRLDSVAGFGVRIKEKE